MALTRLPDELLDMIIDRSLPHSFESLATTCKSVHARCAPRIEHHNKLRARFRKFGYHTDKYDDIVAASDLIALIATDPFVPQYIQTANLDADSCYLKHAIHRQPPKPLPSIDEGGPVVQLFARSTHLQQAELDWREYYTTFAEDVKQKRYSQRGSAFLLTLLSDAKHVKMPLYWDPDAETTRLLETTIGEAMKGSSCGLRAATHVEGCLSTSNSYTAVTSLSAPMLALPHLKSYINQAGFLLDKEGDRLLPCLRPSTSLEVVHLYGYCIDHVGISKFLKHTPRLKTLVYMHCSPDENSPQDWDTCNFVNAIAREVGSHLVELSIQILMLPGRILPGKASLREFRKLKQLEFPLDLVMCNIDAMESPGTVAALVQDLFYDTVNPLVRDLIPPTVTRLGLTSEGLGPHEAIHHMFRNFQTTRKTQMLQLEKIYMQCVPEAPRAYKRHCDNAVKACQKAGVDLVLNPTTAFKSLKWDGDGSPFTAWN